MSFKIEKSGRPNRKEGQYVVINGIEYFVESININTSGKVCLRLRDLIRKDSQVLTICDISELTERIPGATAHYAE